ncbi:MAG: carboxy methyl transferase for protein phosphatase 2A [Phylliscum demangeonii]|nr:MAG: carboxy methyl transferase for protein phosphatase 2A [Phylliscum demangeonii]
MSPSELPPPPPPPAVRALNLLPSSPSSPTPPTSNAQQPPAAAPARGLRSRAGPRRRGRGRLNPHSNSLDDHVQNHKHIHSLSPGSGSSPDHIVQSTDRDASLSRLSAVERGYLDDPFARLFVDEEDEEKDDGGPGKGHGEAARQGRRFPIINRGTYVRTFAIDALVNRFLAVPPPSEAGDGGDDEGEQDAEAGRPLAPDDRHPAHPAHAEKPPPPITRQIISLGAGSDTRYFRLLATLPAAVRASLVYHELDFPCITRRKLRAIRRSETLRSLLTSIEAHGLPAADDHEEDPASLYSPRYNLHPIDLRHLAPPTAASLPNLSRSLPTLLLSECCLMYLPPTDADRILAYFSQHLLPAPTPLAIVLYEPVLAHDAFGQTMIANLARRQIRLPTLARYPSRAAQRARLRRLLGAEGEGAAAADMVFVWDRWVSGREKARVNGLEMLDEIEEWALLGAHYACVWAWREGEGKREAEAEVEMEGKGEEDAQGDSPPPVFEHWSERHLPSQRDETG